MASPLEEKMQGKRQKTITLQATLPGTSRTLRILTFNKAQLPSAHVLETGGLNGMIIFNDNGSTFSQDHTTFMRLIMAMCNFPNIYNYSNKHEYPQVPPWQAGVALPLYEDRTTDTITARIKSVAEDQGQNGLKMASLTFDIVQSDIDLIMRDCTAHHICRSHGLNVPPAIAEAHQVQNPNQILTPPRFGGGSTASSPGSSASHAGSASSGMQPQFVEAINILRGIKRTMQARKMWVEEDEQSQCAQM